MTAFDSTIAWLQVRVQNARAMADVERASDEGSDVVARACDEAADEAIAAMRVLMREAGRGGA